MNQETVYENEKEKKPLRVAAYIRVSTESGNQEDSFETQERYFGQLLAENDCWTSAGIYADYGLSAVTVKKRIGFQRLLRHCQDGRIDRILCKSISRFSRNTRDFVAALRLLKKHGVTILFEKEGLDTGDANNEFVLTALGAVAQEESRNISENIRWGYERRYPKGEARNVAIYGYRYTEDIRRMKSGYQFRQIQPVREEAEVVRRIFLEAAGGSSHAAIARNLNREQVPPPQYLWTRKHRRIREGTKPAKGELKDEIQQGWTPGQIGRILNLERYTGDILLQKTFKRDFLDHQVQRNKGQYPQYLIRDHHPAIVSRELFSQVQKQKTKTAENGQKGGKKGQYAFSGRLVCSCCGRFYHTRNRKNHPIWFCPSTALNNGKTICRAERLYEDQVEEMFRQAFVQRFGGKDNPAGLPELMQKKLEEIQRQDHFERDRAFLNRKIARAKEEASPKEDGQEKVRQLEQTLSSLEAFFKELEEDYAIRSRAILWLEGLPGGPERTDLFWKGLASEYVKAFALSIQVYSPGEFEIRWFDGTSTHFLDSGSGLPAKRRGQDE